jgi:molybdenum cofactor guanylyltransferase
VTSDVTGIVLAGGRSTRFGADKLAAQVEGTSVLDRAIGAVATVAGEVIVVGAAQALPSIPGITCRTVDDPEPFGGPLQALAGGLRATSTDLAIVVAGDMPTLVPDVLALLMETLRSSSDVDAVVLADPRDPSRRQPVPLAIRVAAARMAAGAALEAGDRSLVRLLGRMALVELAAAQWQPLDPEARTLVDIDVPDDLRRLGGAADQRMR